MSASPKAPSPAGSSSVGDTVEVDEPLLEVSTDKVDTEIPSPVAGVLEEILVGEDETVAVGADLAVIGDGSGGRLRRRLPAAGRRGAAPRSRPPAEAPAAEQPAAEAARGRRQPRRRARAGAQPAAGSRSRRRVRRLAAAGTTVTLPALGESVTEGTVTRWLKAVGDEVEVDEPLLEVSTDKVDTEIPSPVAGTLQEILVGEDETVEVGADLAVIGGSGAARPSAAAAGGARAAGRGARAGSRAPARSQAADSPAEPAPPQAAEPSRPQRRHRQPRSRLRPPRRQRRAGRRAGRTSGDAVADAAAYVTPLVRKLAADNGVDLGSLKGTGVGGRIRKQDVLAAAEAAKAAALPRRPQPRRRPRRPRRPPARRRARRVVAPARHHGEDVAACARSSPSAWSSRCRPPPS